MSLSLVRPMNAAGIAEEVRAKLDPELRQIALGVKNAAIQRVVDADKVDTGDLVKGIEDPERFDDGSGEWGYEIVSSSGHSIYVELGRTPGGKQPPHSVLVKWVERRLGLTGPDAESAAWAIGQAIVERGVAGIHFMRGAIEGVSPDQLARELTEALNR